MSDGRGSSTPRNNVTTNNIKAGFSQEQLASLVGTKQMSVSQWERNSRQPRSDTAKRLAKILGLTWHPKTCGYTVPRSPVMQGLPQGVSAILEYDAWAAVHAKCKKLDRPVADVIREQLKQFVEAA